MTWQSTLTAELADAAYADDIAASDYSAIAAALNARAESVTQTTQAKAITLVDVLGALTTAEKSALRPLEWGGVMDTAYATDNDQLVQLADGVGAWLIGRDLLDSLSVSQLAHKMLQDDARTELGYLISLLVGLQIMSAETATTLGALLAQTESVDVTSYADSRATTLGLPTITSAMVQEVLNAAAG